MNQNQTKYEQNTEKRLSKLHDYHNGLLEERDRLLNHYRNVDGEIKSLIETVLHILNNTEKEVWV